MASNDDLEHLNLLGIFHYVVGAVAALFALFPTLHLVFGIAMMTGAIGEQNGGPDAQLVGGFLSGFALIFILFGLAFAGVMIAAGRFLRAHDHYMFCLVVAAVACMFFPFGTVLGVFTIIVLQRQSVKDLFEHQSVEADGEGSTREVST